MGADAEGRRGEASEEELGHGCGNGSAAAAAIDAGGCDLLQGFWKTPFRVSALPRRYEMGETALKPDGPEASAKLGPNFRRASGGFFFSTIFFHVFTVHPPYSCFEIELEKPLNILYIMFTILKWQRIL